MSGMGMRKLRENRHNRVYHLISRIAHRAFYLDADERDRFIDVMKRGAAFSGVWLLAWCVMTNHVHVLVFVPEPEKLSDDDILARMRTPFPIAMTPGEHVVTCTTADGTAASATVKVE